MREMSLAEQRYRAVLAVISDGRAVTEVAAAVGVVRRRCRRLSPSSLESSVWASTPHVRFTSSATVEDEGRRGLAVLCPVTRPAPSRNG
jgi:hypothetical protein